MGGPGPRPGPTAAGPMSTAGFASYASPPTATPILQSALHEVDVAFDKHIEDDEDVGSFRLEDQPEPVTEDTLCCEERESVPVPVWGDVLQERREPQRLSVITAVARRCARKIRQ